MLKQPALRACSRVVCQLGDRASGSSLLPRLLGHASLMRPALRSVAEPSMLPQVLCSMSCMTGMANFTAGTGTCTMTVLKLVLSLQCPVPHWLLRAYAFLTPFPPIPFQGQVASISQSSKKTTSFLSWDWRCPLNWLVLLEAEYTPSTCLTEPLFTYYCILPPFPTRTKHPASIATPEWNT